MQIPFPVPSPEEFAELIKCSLQEKFVLLLAMFDDTCVVRNAQQLTDCEKNIVAINDEIAGRVVEAVVSQSVDDA